MHTEMKELLHCIFGTLLGQYKSDITNTVDP